MKRCATNRVSVYAGIIQTAPTLWNYDVCATELPDDRERWWHAMISGVRQRMLNLRRISRWSDTAGVQRGVSSEARPVLARGNRRNDGV
jgi:hypothetical protein